MENPNAMNPGAYLLKVKSALRGDPLTRDAFNDLDDKNNPERLVRLLCYPVILDANPKSIGEMGKESFPGVTMETLENSPARFESWADEAGKFVERVFNLSDNTIPLECINIRSILLTFATECRKQVEGKKLDLRSAIDTWRDGVSENLDALLLYVEEKKNSPLYERVAELLTATAVALGIHRQYDAEAIRKRVTRYRERTTPLE